jgi:hypothetical protein
MCSHAGDFCFIVSLSLFLPFRHEMPNSQIHTATPVLNIGSYSFEASCIADANQQLSRDACKLVVACAGGLSLLLSNKQ